VNLPESYLKAWAPRFELTIGKHTLAGKHDTIIHKGPRLAIFSYSKSIKKSRIYLVEDLLK